MKGGAIMNRQECAIRVALAMKNKSQRWLAGKFGTTPQNFNARLRRGSFKDEEMQKIADILGMTWETGFKVKE
jgi:hypothetical protein